MTGLDHPADIEAALSAVSADFFPAAEMEAGSKRVLLTTIADQVVAKRQELETLIVDEVHLTARDAKREIDRAVGTFRLAADNAGYSDVREFTAGNKTITERRIARGPALVITPFSSPFSSPAHKISLALLAGTSVLFKPSPLASRCGQALYGIISEAAAGRYVYFTNETDTSKLADLVADERIGIISFTGGYETGQTIIQNGGVKKYHMELSGGNSPVIFTPDFNNFDDGLVDRLLDAIVAKNGQRCVSVKHIFLPADQSGFVAKLQRAMVAASEAVGPLISEDYALKTAAKVGEILASEQQAQALIALERDGAAVLPTMYSFDHIESARIQNMLGYDLPGPVVFIHYYRGDSEYEAVLDTIAGDYVRSGLQLSIFTGSAGLPREIMRRLHWGGIIFNDVPTFRDERMSFGGFGRAGLGKEGFFETARVFTDPQTVSFQRAAD